MKNRSTPMKLQAENLLKEKAVEYKLIKLSQNAHTVEEVVKYSEKENIRPEEICKTIILEGKKTRKKVAILLRGNDRLDFSEAKKVLGEKMAIANKKQVKEASNVEPGAVCPLLLNTELLVDKRVMDLERINCGSGDHLYGLEFKTEDLAKVADYQIVNLTQL